MKNLINNLYLLFEGRHLNYLYFLLSFVIVALFEVFGVGVLPVFFSALSRPQWVLDAPVVHFLSSTLHLSLTPSNIVFWVGAGLTLIFIIKNIILVIIGYMQAKFIAKRQSELSTILFSCYLKMPFSSHTQKNSAELIRNVTGSTFAMFTGVIIPGCVFFTEILVATMIASILMLSNPLPTLISAASLVLFILCFYYFFRQQLEAIAKAQHKESIEIIKWVTQGLKGIKEIKVLGRENFFLQQYEDHIVRYSKASVYFQFINQLPRYFIESLVVAAMVIIVMVMVFQKMPVDNMLPQLSLYGFAVVRLVPSVNRILGSLTTIRFNAHLVDFLANDISNIKRDNLGISNSSNLLKLNKTIKLEAVTFSYPGLSAKKVVDNIDLVIEKGLMVAFVGRSGAGKTTIADVLLGLYRPDKGRVLVDDNDINEDIRQWQKNIGYIPQSIFLTDDSIRRNVAFGLEDSEIDDKKVWSALKSARLEDLVNSLPAGLDTLVGEDGARLSGGQRQRIGIARALFNNPDLLVMDEATSALDNETEAEVSEVLEKIAGNKTIIIIAHRLNTVKKCHLLFMIDEGKLISSGSFDDLYMNNSEFKSLMGLELK